MQMYLCNLYRKLEQLLNGSQLQNAEIQSAAPGTILAVPLFQLSKMGKFGIKDASVYIIIELQDELLE